MNYNFENKRYEIILEGNVASLHVVYVTFQFIFAW